MNDYDRTRNGDYGDQRLRPGHGRPDRWSSTWTRRRRPTTCRSRRASRSATSKWPRSCSARATTASRSTTRCAPTAKHGGLPSCTAAATPAPPRRHDHWSRAGGADDSALVVYGDTVAGRQPLRRQVGREVGARHRVRLRRARHDRRQQARTSRWRSTAAATTTRIRGSQAGDHIAGGSGNDTINGEGGDDHVYGDSGINIDAGDARAVGADLQRGRQPRPDARRPGAGRRHHLRRRGDDIMFGDHGVIDQAPGTLRILTTGNVTRIETDRRRGRRATRFTATRASIASSAARPATPSPATRAATSSSATTASSSTTATATSPRSTRCAPRSPPRRRRHHPRQ